MAHYIKQYLYNMYIFQLKSVMDEVLSTKSHVKDVERETSYIYKDLKVLRDRSGSKSRDSAKRSSR